MIKIIVSDLDGTLLDADHQITNYTADVIKALQVKGYQFLVATGRTYDTVKPLLDNHGIQCECLVMNGAMVVNQHGEVLYDKPMINAHVVEIFTLLQELQVQFQMYADIGTVTDDAHAARLAFGAHMRRKGMRDEEIEQIIEEGGFCQFAEEIKNIHDFLAQGHKIYKIEVFGEAENLEKARETLLQKEEYAVTNSFENNIEITDVSAQKGYTLTAMFKARNIQVEDVVVFGDSLNDLSMMKLFPNSVAMKNGVKIIKEHAKYCTCYPNYEEGVAKVIEGLLADGDLHHIEIN